MIEFYLLGVIWGTLIEWLIHKYLLHKLTLKFKLKFHLEHHTFAARENGGDHDYAVSLLKSKQRLKELGALALVSAVHLPMIIFSPAFYFGSLTIVIGYYVLHSMSHKNVEWGWRWMPWHMEHHLVSAKGNFGVVTPFWDYVFGTRITQRKR